MPGPTSAVRGWRRAVAAGVWLAGCAWAPAQAASLAFCDRPRPPTAGQQDRLLRVALLLKDELARSGASAALVARAGTNLSWIGQRYSHAGISLRETDGPPWAVRQLYYACDEGRPQIFDEGLSAFIQGAASPRQGFFTLMILPGQAGEAVARAARDKPLALQLLGGRYSANAYAFDTRYQNCNQWVAELLAMAWGALPTGPASRLAAQTWLREQGYRGQRVETGALFGLSAFIPWTHSDDHPPEQLAQTVFEVSMPESIEAFVRRQVPGVHRLELCHDERRAVIRRDGPPIADGCVARDGDTVVALD